MEEEVPYGIDVRFHAPVDNKFDYYLIAGETIIWWSTPIWFILPSQSRCDYSQNKET
jgi:hypothetical protein